MLKDRFSSVLDPKPQPLFEPNSRLNDFQRTQENFRSIEQGVPINFRNEQRTPENFNSFEQRRPQNFRSIDQRRPESFRSIDKSSPENFQNSFFGQEPINPVNIFSRSRPLTNNNQLPPPPPPPLPAQQVPGPFANPVPEIEEELEAFRAEAEKANESAIKKQIEALKKIIASQNEQK